MRRNTRTPEAVLLREAERCAEVVARFGADFFRGATLDDERREEIIRARAKLEGIEEALEAFGYRLGWASDEPDDISVGIFPLD